MRPDALRRIFTAMKTAIIAALLLIAACTDEEDMPTPDDRRPRIDYVMQYAEALERYAIRCGLPNADYFAEWASERDCASRDCNALMDAIDMGPCVAAYEGLTCTDDGFQMVPLACVEPLYP